MKVTELLELIAKPIMVIVGLLIIVTFALFIDDLSWTHARRILRILNLRWENTLGTWFEGVLFLITAMSFAVFGWSKVENAALPKLTKYIFRLMALAFCFLAVDEVASIHELVGRVTEKTTGVLEQTPIDQYGFSWILIYGPVCIIVLILITKIFLKLIRHLPDTDKKISRTILYATVICAFLLPLFEVVEGYLAFLGHKETILLCFEESFELLVLCGFTWNNTRIAKRFDL